MNYFMSNQRERFGEINFDITDCLLCGKILSGVGFLHRKNHCLHQIYAHQFVIIHKE